MGLSVYNQCDSRHYFSLSTISKEAMRQAGLTMTIKELKEMARKTNPSMVLITGETHARGQRRQTNVYKYEDFLKNTG